MWKVLLVLYILQFRTTLVNSNELKIAFLVNPVQKELFTDISASIKEVEQMHVKAIVKDFMLVIDKDQTGSDDYLGRLCNILSTEGISIIVDFTYEDWNEGLTFIKQKRIPYMRIDVPISPFLRSFSKFLEKKGASDVVLIFENEQNSEEALYHIIRGFPFRTIIINAGNNRIDFSKRIQSLRPTPSYLAVFASGLKINSIFKKLKESNLFARPEEWHFIFLDTNDSSFEFSIEAENATRFTINEKVLCDALKMARSYCGSDFKIQKAIILSIVKWLLEAQKNDANLLQPLKSDCQGNSSTKLYFNVMDIRSNLDSEFLTLTQEHVVTFSLNMSISLFSPNENSEILAYSKEGQLKFINQTVRPANRFFRIGVAEAIPWSYPVPSQKDGGLIWEGYCIDFIVELSKRMNFIYKLVAPNRGHFGKRDAFNGRWDGIVGDLVTGETDFAVAALKMTSEREEVIDFIAPYFEQTGISIVIRKAVRQTSLFKFMTVLRLEVWLSIIAALIATAFMIWLLDKYSPYSAKNNKKAYPYPCRDFTLKESFWFALTSFTPQGGGEAPKSISGRILVAAYWLFVVLMLATFTANLAAFLTVERMQAPVQSLEQLARQSRINYTVVEGSDTHKYFINMKFAEDTLYRMWKELVLNATKDQARYRIWDYPIKEQYGHILLAINGSIPVNNAAEGFRKVNEHENADFAFIHDSAEIKYEVTRNCNLTEVGEVFAEQPYAVAVQQGSHLADEISYKIVEMQKDRFFEKLTAKYWNHSLNKACSRSEDQEGISLESLGGVFIATLFGLVLAMITLAAEVIFYKRKQTIKATLTKIIPVKEAPVIKTVYEEQVGLTPPPSFEEATFRGKKIPKKITLGKGEFQPRKTRGRTHQLKVLEKPSNIGVSSQTTFRLPMYYE